MTLLEILEIELGVNFKDSPTMVMISISNFFTFLMKCFTIIWSNLYSFCSNVPVKYVASKVRFYSTKLSHIGWSMNSVKKGESFRHVLRTVVIQSII